MKYFARRNLRKQINLLHQSDYDYMHAKIEEIAKQISEVSTVREHILNRLVLDSQMNSVGIVLVNRVFYEQRSRSGRIMGVSGQELYLALMERLVLIHQIAPKRFRTKQ